MWKQTENTGPPYHMEWQARGLQRCIKSYTMPLVPGTKRILMMGVNHTGKKLCR